MTYPIPDKIFNSHFAALAKTGAGKSYTFAGIIEHLLEQKRRVCVIDPKGDYWGLRSSADGKSAGYPIMLFGDFKRPDLPERLPLNDRAGKEVAKLIVSGNRPAVFGFRGWTEASMIRFYVDFMSTIYNLVDSPLNLFIDEMQNFAPKGMILGDGDAKKALHWSKRIASEGRGIGLRIGIASQRPQKVHNDVLDCCETLIAMRTVHPKARLAIKEWIDGNGDPEHGIEIMKSLAGMNVGEAFVWSPENKFLERVQFPKIKTYDSYRTPTESEKVVTPKGWASVDLEEVRAKLGSLVEEAKANDPAELKKQLADLKRQVAEQTKLATATSLKAGVKVDVRPLVEKEVAKAKQDFERQMKPYKEHTERLIMAVGNFVKTVKPLIDETPVAQIVAPALHIKMQFPPRTKEVRVVGGPTYTVRDVAASNGEMTKAQRAILNSLAWWMALGFDRPTKEQVALVGGMSPRGGHFTNSLGSCRTSLWLDYPGPGLVSLTVDGSKLAVAPNGQPTGQELHDRIMSVLKSVAHRKIFSVLWENPAEATKEQLSEWAALRGGHFTNSLGRIRTLGICEYPRPGNVKLAEWIAKLQ